MDWDHQVGGSLLIIEGIASLLQKEARDDLRTGKSRPHSSDSAGTGPDPMEAALP